MIPSREIKWNVGLTVWKEVTRWWFLTLLYRFSSMLTWIFIDVRFYCTWFDSLFDTPQLKYKQLAISYRSRANKFLVALIYLHECCWNGTNWKFDFRIWKESKNCHWFVMKWKREHIPVRQRIFMCIVHCILEVCTYAWAYVCVWFNQHSIRFGNVMPCHAMPLASLNPNRSHDMVNLYRANALVNGSVVNEHTYQLNSTNYRK